ncbi:MULTISPECIES: hypothetical protein [Ralstonia solanacearum species complex]|uniref:HTH araC/xylS-type domain-containing protein n=3 Tax=Ralstonia solanacearum species complex TaxID=3116862 RepID=A0A0S4U8L6_RALSL|nr:hypothetical protein [Ralstonia pseudosolanacearum]NKA11583.1 hypothetical protein [Ralstonia solanacearum]MCK4135056.1 hypothetical protein [Ralstonia pseudosolanacearum]MCK4144924.1 hypothetical protein [Ralstonia pseudosolanacearum]MDK1383028.1 hypothetical protein [Ralstonia pseudosolanacearum]NKA55272.1 hypothetical protein [Ralstonia solanacearum]
MYVQLQCRSPILLQRLMPAFPVTLTARVDGHSICRDTYRRALPAGRPVRMPAFQPFDLQLTGHAFNAAACTLELNEGEPDASPEGALPALLSRLIFRAPDTLWNAGSVAHTLGIEPRHLRQLLFARGATLGQLCKTQRLMRALFESAQREIPVGHLKRRIGWPQTRDLEAPFYEWFGVSLQTVARLRGGGL